MKSRPISAMTLRRNVAHMIGMPLKAVDIQAEQLSGIHWKVALTAMYSLKNAQPDREHVLIYAEEEAWGKTRSEALGNVRNAIMDIVRTDIIQAEEGEEDNLFYRDELDVLETIGQTVAPDLESVTYSVDENYYDDSIEVEYTIVKE